MRDGGDFIKDLRAEVAATQQRRHDHIRAKMLFLVSLLGIGIASPLSTDLSTVLYLTPLVVLIFDLQILGEDFGVKRAGAFIARCPDSPVAEKNWEEIVRKNRDEFAAYADLLGSTFVLVAAAAGLWDKTGGTFIYWSWLTINTCVIAFIWKFGKSRVRRLERFETSLAETYPKESPDG